MDQKTPPITSETKEEELVFDFEYAPDPTVNPTELAGNANLALHHHMAPPDGSDEEDDE